MATTHAATIVTYDGHECLAQMKECESFEPSAKWMPPAALADLLNRLGMADPERMALSFAGVIAVETVAIPYLIHCLHRISPLPSVATYQCDANTLALSPIIWRNKKQDIILAFGQCSSCRLIHWAQLIGHDCRAEFRVVADKVPFKMRLVNGPPRRIA